MTSVLRGLLFVVYWTAVLIGFVAFCVFVIGLSLGESDCFLKHEPCPKPGFWIGLGQRIAFLGWIPMSALGFIAYRKLVIRILPSDQ